MDIEVNQILTDTAGKKVIIKKIYLPDLQGRRIVEYQYLKMAGLRLLPLDNFLKYFSI